MAGRHARGATPAGEGSATADLHVHTTRSDGLLEPVELVRDAHAAGVRLLAISDHDTLAAHRELTVPGAPPLPRGLELVAAVEINAVTGPGWGLPDAELHLLGIGVDPRDDAFEALLERQRAGRRERFAAARARLRELGMPVDGHLEGQGAAAEAPGRPALARALVAAGHAVDVEDAFRRHLAPGRPAHVPRAGIGPIEAIRAIRAAGGLASLAHLPAVLERPELVAELRAAGLDGLETHHRSFDEPTRAALSAFAGAAGLVETGGTDHHGDTGPYAASHAALVLPETLVDGVRARLGLSRSARP